MADQVSATAVKQVPKRSSMPAIFSVEPLGTFRAEPEGDLGLNEDGRAGRESRRAMDPSTTSACI
jgi:hypothetical protein